MPDTTPSLLDRTLANLRRVWHDIAGNAASSWRGGFDPDLGPAAAAEMRGRLAECLDVRGGEVSARARAADLGESYLKLSPAGKAQFLRLLAQDFDVDRAAITDLAARYAAAADDQRPALEGALREALTAPRKKLLTQFNALPQGVKFLVDLRADLLDIRGKDAALAGLDQDLADLLSAWFDIGFLDLVRIDWNSPAALLEKLIAYEAVHKIASWADLRNRLDSDRRCYAFIHPRMPDEPLIFVEVALVNGLASNVQVLLDEGAPMDDPRQADTAIFYSISNAQTGLRGIAFGNFLIKKVVDHLSRDFPGLKHFATLSPIPGFRRWFDALSAAEREALIGPRRAEILVEHLERPDWHLDSDSAEILREPLAGLAAHYLTAIKKDGKPLDPVARFHLGNGASVERINWLGDVSAKGRKESYGLMVNYRYRLADIEANHEAFVGEGRIAASDSVRSQAKLRDSDRRFLRFASGGR